MYSIEKEARRFKREIQMEDVETEENVSNVCKSAKQAKEYAKNNANDKGNVGKEANARAVYPDRIKKADVDKENTHKWLRSAS